MGKAGPSNFFFQLCDKPISAQMKSQLSQHLKSKGHMKAQEAKASWSAVQCQLGFLGRNKKKKSRFDMVSKDLCTAFLSASIPWVKLNNPELCLCLERHKGISIPDGSSLRRKSECYQEVCILSWMTKIG